MVKAGPAHSKKSAARAKHRRSVLAAELQSNSKKKQQPVNPFDFRYNKLKQTQVVGKHRSANIANKGLKIVSGRPVEAKSRSQAVRKQTLTNLLVKEGKNNQFEDRRIGANQSKFGGSKNLDESVFEDMMFKKFALQRQSLAKTNPLQMGFTNHKTGKNKYNLDDHDDEGIRDSGGLGESVELTHLGQSIGQMERFEIPTAAVLSDDDNVQDNMFEQALRDTDNGTTLKEKMQKLVAVSQMTKAIQQETNNQIADQTNNLDENWKEISHLLNKVNVATDLTATKKELETDKSYSNCLELLDENPVRAKPDDPLKPDQVSINDECKTKSEVFVSFEKPVPEKRNPDLKPVPVNHVSADDLGESFCNSLSSRNSSAKLDVEYTKEGDVVLPKEFANKPYARILRTNRRLSEDESDEGADEDELDLLEDNENSLDDDDDDDEESSCSGSGQESYNESGSENAESNSENEEAEVNSSQILTSDFFPQDYNDFFNNVMAEYSKGGENLKEYFDNLNTKLFPRTDYKRTCSKLLLNLVKSIELHVQSLALAAFLDKSFIVIICSAARKICVKNVESSLALFQNIIMEKFASMKKVDCLDIHFYIVMRLIFSIYDLKHCKKLADFQLMLTVMISKCITKCKLSSMTDLRCYLLYGELMFQLNSLEDSSDESACFVPEVLVVLENVLTLVTCADVNGIEILQVPSGFLKSGLEITNKKLAKSTVTVDQLVYETSVRMKQTPSTRFRLISFAVSLLNSCFAVWNSLASVAESFKNLNEIVSSILCEDWAISDCVLRHDLVSFVDSFESLKDREAPKLQVAVEKPRLLKQFTPKLIDGFDEIAKTRGSAWGKQNEKRRMARKLKRETRGAMKELQKDTVFMQQMRLADQLEKDKERKRKVKEIYGQLANQEGDVKKCQKSKFQLI